MRTLCVLTIMLLCTLTEIAAETGNAPFCLQTSSGAKCVYMTMGDCERARGDTSGTQCITQADAHGVTGLGKPLGSSPAVPSYEAR
jgi:hypothetical protein